MNKYLFLILWGLISPGCLGLTYTILSLLSLLPTGWNLGSGISLLTITAYLSYWILLGILQSRLIFWKFKNKKFAIQWFLRTSIVGFLVMLSHDIVLAMMGIDTGGQGSLILLISNPIRTVCGSLILGFIQFLLIKSYCYQNNRAIDLWGGLYCWLVISLFSWIIGLVGVYFQQGVFLFFAIGTTLKGLFINYLKISNEID